VRPALVVALCILAALAGAGGVLFAVEQGGWTDGGSQTVLVREPLVRSSLPATVVVSKPVLARGFSPQRIYDTRGPGVVTIFSYFGRNAASSTLQEGSGFVVDRSGVVLTAAHVVVSAGGSAALAAPARSVYVQFADGDRVPAQIVGWDPYDDVGVLRVRPSAHALVPVPLGSSAGVAVGQPVAAIGSPFGVVASLSVGVVSGTGRTIPSLTTAYNLYDAIQTDAPINHGNSGGPLFDARGRVIGINAQIRSDSGNAEGVGFAVPINSARRSMEQLIANGSISYPFVGIATTDLTPALAKHFGYSVQHGAVVTNVEASSPGRSAGLRAWTSGRRRQFLGVGFAPGGDVILAIAGRPVRSSEDVVRIITEDLSPGQTVRLTIARGGSRLEVPVRLAERPTTP